MACRFAWQSCRFEDLVRPAQLEHPLAPLLDLLALGPSLPDRGVLLVGLDLMHVLAQRFEGRNRWLTAAPLAALGSSRGATLIRRRRASPTVPGTYPCGATQAVTSSRHAKCKAFERQPAVSMRQIPDSGSRTYCACISHSLPERTDGLESIASPMSVQLMLSDWSMTASGTASLPWMGASSHSGRAGIPAILDAAASR